MKVVLFVEDGESVQGLPYLVSCVREVPEIEKTQVYLVTNSAHAWSLAYATGVDGIIESPSPDSADDLIRMLYARQGRRSEQEFLT